MTAPLSSEPGFSPRAPSPTALWQSVLTARAVLARHRCEPGGHVDQEASADLLDALEAYVESLTARRLPVPYAIRDELRIRRLTSRSSQRPQVGRGGRGPSRGY